MVRGEHDVGGSRADALCLPSNTGTDGQVLIVEANGAEPEEQPALPGVAGIALAVSSIYDELGAALPQGLGTWPAQLVSTFCHPRHPRRGGATGRPEGGGTPSGTPQAAGLPA